MFQVVNFYKTIADHMIMCQQPMMIAAANNFTKLLLEQKDITWDNPNSLKSYVSKLQVAVENLSRENRKLRKYHYSVCEKVFIFTLLNNIPSMYIGEGEGGYFWLK